MTFNDWEWNNGQYFKYLLPDYKKVIIRKFQTKEALQDFGHLIIDDQIVKTGIELNATTIEEGMVKLLEYFQQNF